MKKLKSYVILCCAVAMFCASLCIYAMRTYSDTVSGVALFGIFGGDVNADPTRLTRVGDNIILGWEEVTTDVSGNVEHIDYYTIYYRVHGASDWIAYSEVVATNGTVFHVDLGNGTWDFGVSATDFSGNESEIHSSLDMTAIPTGGWYLLWSYDQENLAPKVPAGLRIVSE